MEKTKEEKPKAVDLNLLFTKQHAENGTWLDLSSNGQNFRLKVRGTETTAFKVAIARDNQAEISLPELTPEQFASPEEVERRHLVKSKTLASLVMDWEGIEQPFSEEFAMNLIAQNATVFSKINHFCSDSKNFMKPS